VPRSTRWRRPSNGGGWRAEYRALSPLQRSAGRAIVSARRRAQARPLAAALPPAGHGRGRRTGGCRTIDPWSALWGDPQGEVRGAAGYQRGRQDRPQPIWLQKMGSRGNLPPRGCFPQGQSLQGSRGVQAIACAPKKLLGRYRPGAGACQDECTRGWTLVDGVCLRRQTTRRLIASRCVKLEA